MTGDTINNTPRELLAYGNVYQVWKIYNRARELSPLDGESLPTITMLPFILQDYCFLDSWRIVRKFKKVINLTKEEFLEAVGCCHSYLLNYIYKKRSIELQKMRNK